MASASPSPTARRWRLLALALAAAVAVPLVLFFWPMPEPSAVADSQWERLTARRQALRDRIAARPAAVTPAPGIAPVPGVGAGAEVPPGGLSPSVEAETPTAPPAPVLAPVARASVEVLASQRAAAARATSVLDLQVHRTTTSAAVQGFEGFSAGTLTNLHPGVNEWHLLSLRGNAPEGSWHFALTAPSRDRIRLDDRFPAGVVLTNIDGDTDCALWGPSAATPLVEAAGKPTPYVNLCDGRLILRNAGKGHRTSRERATDFLRDKVAGGEQITQFVRKTVYKDRWRQEAKVAANATPAAGDPAGPRSVRIDPSKEGLALLPEGLGLDLVGASGAVRAGAWYGVQGLPGAWVATATPRLADPAIGRAFPQLLPGLDAVEQDSLAFLLAFDLDTFTLGFTLGSDHPRVGWSERAPNSARDNRPGPDGFGTTTPLARTGILTPSEVTRVVAAFTAGFKRSHGAFKNGPMSLVHNASHYGFIEQGVVMSRLQPGLSTVVVDIDGRVDIRVWREDEPTDNVAFARQNGVPLVETGPDGPKPGDLVPKWGAGNWSGSADEKLRSLRAGACLIEEGGRRFLVYGWFSTATPSGMARIFLAAGCRDAMLLDMNALEHTYAALYRVDQGELQVRHLADGMEVLDAEANGRVIPRFLGFSDNRDFFWVVRKEGSR